MHPDLFHLPFIFGSIDVSAYAFFLWSAMIVMVVGLYMLSRSQRYSAFQATGMSIGVMTLALVGARLMHILTNWPAYRVYPDEMYSLNFHGLSIFGGITIVGLFIFFVGFVKRVPQWKKADFLVPYAGVSLILARIGCFLGGCCFGVVTSMPWGVRFPLLSDAHLFQLAHGQTNLLASNPVHPTQLYEIIGVCIGTIVALKLRHTKRFIAGDTLVTFIGIYFFTRFVIHFFRAYPETFSSAHVFPYIYGAISALCLMYMLFRKQAELPMKKRRKQR